MELPILNDLAVILGLSVVILYAVSLLRVPTVVGFLLTGMAIGPYGFGLISAVHEVEIIAEIGVILLLFTIGVEFSLARIARMKKSVLLGGSLQVSGVLLTIMVLYWLLGAPLSKAFFIGCLIALSSTAVVLKILQDKAQLEAPHGRLALAILIFQDIAVVPMMLVAPILGGQSESPILAFVMMLIKGVLIVAAAYVLARHVVPALFYRVTRARSSELFLLSVAALALIVAWATSSLGLSLGLGAFLAGLIISESEYSHQALAGVLPLRDLFMSFFFISIGMLLNLGYFFQHFPIIVILTVFVMFIKAGAASSACLCIGTPLRAAVLAGAAIGQIGEFSFILAQVGLRYDLISDSAYQLFLAVSILSMIATPFLIQWAPTLAEQAMRLPLPGRMKLGAAAEETEPVVPHEQDHLVIVGFGLVGRNLARAARMAEIPYVIVEMNSRTVRDEKANGEPIFYGDAAHAAVLQHASVESARALAVVIADAAATARIVETARLLNPGLYIIARTRFVTEVNPLYALGADEVIPEEYETSIEIFTRVLMKYLASKEAIERFAHDIRSGGYGMFRSPSVRQRGLGDLSLSHADLAVNVVHVHEGAYLAGKTFAQIDMRNRFSLTAVAVRRFGKILPNPEGHWVIFERDDLILLGPSAKIATLIDYLHSSAGESS
ncbi:MAG: potassium transporter KefB [bacterium]|nr:potassium transporter KefB [bacterium]